MSPLSFLCLGLALLVAGPGCGGDAGAPPPLHEAVADTGPDALRAFSEQELREAMRVGYAVTYDLVGLFPSPKKERMYVRHRVTEVTAEGVRIEIQWLNHEFRPVEFAQEAVKATKAEFHTWKELSDERAWKPDTVVVTEETIETPAGTFDCRHFDLGGWPGLTSHSWYSSDLPGFPVRVQEQGKLKPLLTRSAVRKARPPTEETK